MGKYICKICGKEFDRIGNAVYCPGPHYRPCPICGEPVEFHRLSESVKCCSKECTDILSARSKQKLKICKECGREFISNQASHVYCSGPHHTTCVICGKEFEYTCSPKEKPNTCSRECQEVLRSQTAMTRYGVANVSELDEVKHKISVANRSEAVAAIRRVTSLARWGVDNPAKNLSVRSRMSEIMKTDKYLSHRAETCREKYGYTTPMLNPDVLARRRSTNLDRYGCLGHVISEKEMAGKMIDGSKVKEFLAFKQDPQTYIESHYADLPTVSQLELDLGVTNTPIYDILVAHNCQDMIARYSSSMESEIVLWLRELKSDIQIVRNDRTIIKPQEIDIYLPEYGIGIECNPTATHNSSVADPWGAPPKSYKYHWYKSQLAASAGIFLFHVFGYEWIHKQAAIKSMIANLIGITPSRIAARNTTVVELSDQECKQFLDTNHRQGQVTARVCLGLKYADQLVSVMTFNHLRASMGKSTQDSDDSWELSRFCNALNTSVVGGASKLFKYFIEHHCPSTVISFSDRAHTRGQLYSILGFTQYSETLPGYVWVEQHDRTYYHRVRCQKRFLKQLLNDESIDLSQTEREIMESHGFVRVYDSGVIKWVWNVDSL